jgi:4,5-DOPA dioxygenase extradiol
MQPVFFISHGVSDSISRDTPIQQFLKKLKLNLDTNKPAAIIICSSQWETENLEISYSIKKEIIHHKDTLSYKQPHLYCPPLNIFIAKKIEECLLNNKISYSINSNRQLDYGVSQPLSILFPHANIPVIQFSTVKNSSPEQYFLLGQVLKEFSKNNLLIRGSGIFTYNEQALNLAKELESHSLSTGANAFVNWMEQQTSKNCIDNLFDYQSLAPHASLQHNKHLHLLPFFLSLGASQPNGFELIHKSCDLSLSLDCYGNKKI